MRLNKKIAIITGGGSGIGKAIAMAFVREGAHVVIVGRDSKKLALAAEEIGENCLAIAADVSHANDVRKLVSAALEKFKRVDILVNNAAVLLPGTAEYSANRILTRLLISMFADCGFCRGPCCRTCALLAAGRSSILARC